MVWLSAMTRLPSDSVTRFSELLLLFCTSSWAWQRFVSAFESEHGNTVAL